MSSSRRHAPFLFVSLVLATALGACSFVGKLSPGGASTPDVVDVGDDPVDSASATVVDEEDPEVEQDVRYLSQIIDGYQSNIESGGSPRLSAIDQDLARRLYLEPTDNIRNSKNFESMRERYLGLRRGFAKRAGKRAVAIMGDGVPATIEVDEDAVAALDDAFDACKELGRIANSEDRLAVYEAKLARARKIDEATLRANGNDIRIAACELIIGQRSMDFEDEYRPEEVAHDIDRGCGQLELSIRQVKTGRGWGSWEYAMGSTSYGEKVSCRKLAKRKRLPKGAASAVKEGLARIDAKGVAVWNGKYTTQVDDDDYHVYRYATLTFHSKNMAFSANPCGGKSDKLVCEASGSKSVAFFNRLRHWRERAAVHKEAGRADRCKALLKNAVAEYEGFSSLHESLTRSGGWTEGLRYKPRDAKKPMNEKAFLAAFEKAGKQADDDAIGGWCGDK